MNLLQALLQTYDNALAAGIVDNEPTSTEPSILPLYHSNKKSLSGEDMVEILLTPQGDFITGKFLPKDTYVVYPVSEGSIIRTSGYCPHPLCDDLTYLSAPVPGLSSKDEKKWAEKHELYLEELEQLKEFSNTMPNADFEAIYCYIKQERICRDVMQIIQDTRDGKDYTQQGDVISWIENIKDTEKKCSLTISKLFFTFSIEHDEGAISVTQNQGLHQFYIAYVRQQMQQKPQETCDITGKRTYCISSHRGIMGTAKLISISNHKETYAGTIFKTGEEVFHIGYETSQKIHNMLKLLLDKSAFNSYLGGGAYIISWLVQDLAKGGAPLLDESVVDTDPWAMEEEDTSYPKEPDYTKLGSTRSRALVSYFAGAKELREEDGDRAFCVLIVEKVNNGRVAVKYFHTFTASDIQQRAMNWYDSLAWPVWDVEDKKVKLQTPLLWRLVHFLYGMEANGSISCKQDTLQRNALERLIPCVIEGKSLPRDMKDKAFYQLMNRQSYKKCWNLALSLGCSLFKKFHWDTHTWDPAYFSLSPKGVIQYMDKRSFAYGRLLAAYEKLEQDALAVKQDGSVGADTTRTTNAQRLWSAMIHQPLKIAALLEARTKYYRNALDKKNKGLSVMYEKLFSVLYDEIRIYDADLTQRMRQANEDFVLGYYHQKQMFYTKKETKQ